LNRQRQARRMSRLFQPGAAAGWPSPPLRPPAPGHCSWPGPTPTAEERPLGPARLGARPRSRIGCGRMPYDYAAVTPESVKQETDAALAEADRLLNHAA